VALALLAGHTRLRRALLAMALALALLAGAWVWLRHSPLAAVSHVHLAGVRGPEAGAIQTALEQAARRMSTLDVNSRALQAAVAPFPIVREIRVSASFPHTLRIRVVEQLPVANVVVGGVRTAAAGDGVVLGPALLSGSLPTVNASNELPAGKRENDPRVLGQLALLGAAPAPILHLTTRMYAGPKGLTAVMRNGLLVYFGDASRPHAKWLSLVRVLADAGTAGASYIDERLPERPAAGFASGVAPLASQSTSTAATGAEPSGTTETAVAALSAALGSSAEPSQKAGEAGSTPGSSSSESTTGAPAESTGTGASEQAGSGEEPSG
jgi:cell division septal protein FtsQ